LRVKKREEKGEVGRKARERKAKDKYFFAAQQ
jgi:hypothetical protein